ncbi:MAG: thioesterase family protein [Chloroflexota bacterium]
MAQETSHPFDQALQFEFEKEGETAFGHTSPAYANMIGPYGGLTAAALLKGPLTHPAAIGEPLALTVNFASAVKEGRFEINTTEMRTNRSTQHWFMTQSSGDEIVTTGTAIFANRRKTWSSTEYQPPAIPTFESMASMPRGSKPAFAGMYDIRVVGGEGQMFGAKDVDGNPTAESLLWVRDNPARPLDFLSLVAIADIFFPRIFVRRGRFVPAGTVSMTIYFHAGKAELKAIGESALIGHARAGRFWNNYFDQAAELWTADGQLLATTNQIVYFKE